MSKNKETSLVDINIKLKEEIESLKQKVVKLMLEKDDLKYVTCLNIQTKYMIEFGEMEYKVYESYCEWLRQKRKLEMIQARVNRNEYVDIREIEKNLDDEFDEYRKKLKDILDKINTAKELETSRPLSSEESKELKALYRMIIKKLHPDLNEVDQTMINLFQQAVEAYKCGDLKTIIMIANLLEEDNIEEVEEKELSLAEKKDTLLEVIKNIENDILEIKDNYPYKYIEIIESEQTMNNRHLELKEMYKRYNEYINIYKERIEELVRLRNERLS